MPNKRVFRKHGPCGAVEAAPRGQVASEWFFDYDPSLLGQAGGAEPFDDRGDLGIAPRHRRVVAARYHQRRIVHRRARCSKRERPVCANAPTRLCGKRNVLNIV